MSTKKLWGGRFQQQASKWVDEFGASISFDQQLADEDIEGSLAHVKMLGHTKILDQTDVDQIVAGLEALQQELHEGKLKFTVENEDIHMNIEALLTEKIGPVAGKLHTARSRNDQVATDFHLYLKNRLPKIVAEITTLQKTLVEMAEKNVETVMPGYTHLQHAQPISYGHYLMAYYQMLKRDKERFTFNMTHTDIMPLGAAALAGTTFPIDRQYTAKQLGFGQVYANSLDAVSDRDFALEFLSNSSILMCISLVFVRKSVCG
ncbi:argininosuccinate lyase [Lentilactobacillus parafarraginis F0439]|uniref:argininosuccinate lyase n=1 Tax=Lentilactobacillus parafarraginis F0439 TaxID=797515 RepID=G9ZLI6_9LACO|nr:argininosuccinate lyase [Lentilactobacillus parafarraginis F0439]